MYFNWFKHCDLNAVNYFYSGRTSSLVKKFGRRKILRTEKCIVKQNQNADSSVKKLSFSTKNEKGKLTL